MHNQQKHQKPKSERIHNEPESNSNEHKPTETEAEHRHKTGLPRFKLPFFHKSDNTEEAERRTERGVSFGNDLGLPPKAAGGAIQRYGAMNNFTTNRKNPSTIFKPPFGTNADEHHTKLGEHTKHLWRFNKITDLTVNLGGIQYPCHKTVLSCHSTYFKDLLLEETGPVNVIHLKLRSVTTGSFEVLLSYMYTSELNLTCQNIGEVYTAARKLGIDAALLLCIRILTGKSKHTVYSVYVYVTAKKERMHVCAAKALKIMTKRFEHIVGTPEFLDLDYSQVMEYLSQDILATRSEMVVYLAALKWLSVKFLDREEYASDLISCVRFQMMTLNEMLACFTPPLLPGILQIKEINDQLTAATCYVAAATVNVEKRFEQFACKPRKYLIKKEPFIPWDPSIFDEGRYEKYKEEMAATTIQAAFRGYQTRKSIEADRDAGLLQLPVEEFQEFEPPKDDDDETYIPGSEIHPAPSILQNIRKSIVSLMSSTDEGEKVSDEKESRKSDKNGAQQETDQKEESHSKEEKTYSKEEGSEQKESSSPKKRYIYRRSSSLETLIAQVAYVTENAEIENYTRDKILDLNKPMFKQSYEKSKTVHQVYEKSKSEENLKEHIDKKSSASSQESMSVSENSEGYLFVTGGFRSDDTKDSTEGKAVFLYSVANDNWKKYGNMDKARHHHCLVLLNNAVYSIGGCNPRKTKGGKMCPDKACYKFDLDSGKWSKISKLKNSRMYHGVAEIGGKIYVVGGKDDKDRILNSIEVYNPESNKWEVSDLDLEMPTIGIGVCVHKGKIWTVGGMHIADDGTIQILNSVRSLDLETNSWDNNHGQLPFPRAFSTLVSFGDDLYVIGGTSKSEGDEECTSVSDVFYYDGQKKFWVSTTDLLFARHFVEANVIGNQLYVLGGLSTFHSAFIDQLLLFDKKTQKWNPCAPFPEPLCGFAAIAIPRAPGK